MIVLMQPRLSESFKNYEVCKKNICAKIFFEKKKMVSNARILWIVVILLIILFLICHIVIEFILLLNFRLLLTHDVLLQDQFTFHLLPTISHGSTIPEQAKAEWYKCGRKKKFRTCY